MSYAHAEIFDRASSLENGDDLNEFVKYLKRFIDANKPSNERDQVGSKALAVTDRGGVIAMKLLISQKIRSGDASCDVLGSYIL